MIRRLSALTLLLAISVVVLGSAPAMAHPLGNFTTNTSVSILPSDAAVQVIYILDLAEIPAQQASRAIQDQGEQGWAQDTCQGITAAQSMTVGGERIPLQLETVGLSFPPGAAGLTTLRLRCASRVTPDRAAGSATITYVDGYEADRIGWREVLAAGDGVEVSSSDVPSVSLSDQLRTYPTATRSSVTTAEFSYDPGVSGPADDAATLLAADVEVFESAAPKGGLEGLVERYTELVARQDLTVGFVLLAIVLAIALGTAHAVAPGHGKTIIAAYMLGEGGKAKQAVALGSTVAVTHTIGVLALGVLVQTSSTLAPERLYPILGVMGGVLFSLVGVTLLYRAITSRGHDHDHGHAHGHGADHGHDHEFHEVDVGVRVPVGAGGVPTEEHTHGAERSTLVAAGSVSGESPATSGTHTDRHHDHALGEHSHGGTREPRPTGWRMLILPGLAGGMVPSPSALLVLLGGIAIGRTWFGVILVMAYGVGMALALVGAGYLLHRVRFKISERLEGQTWARISTALPIATSSLIIIGGLVIVARSLVIA